jgi:hypothetical protein
MEKSPSDNQRFFGASVYQQATRNQNACLEDEAFIGSGAALKGRQIKDLR